MHTHAAKGTEVHSGEQFGIRGYWVNKDPDNPDVVYIEDIEDEVPEHAGRTTYIYFGPNQPTPEEINFLKQTMPGEIVSGDTWF
ncbi:MULTISPECIES: hypothetical protein [Legionella]|uniref:Uncharacterized protein n=1 Tax=Legionella donaldsonii TaxID=45060 RepID=A0A378J304_9GAMM|nr:hypothetical protein [Legionella donaldsonii]STX42005.1 Uncharacterised protein [Legionella donaldsonii]